MLGWFRERSAKRSNHPTVYVCTAPKLRKVAKNEDEDGEYAIKTIYGSRNINIYYLALHTQQKPPDPWFRASARP